MINIFLVSGYLKAWIFFNELVSKPVSSGDPVPGKKLPSSWRWRETYKTYRV